MSFFLKLLSKNKDAFILQFFLSLTPIFKAEISLRTELRHFCTILICVTAFHIVPCTFGESYCNDINLGACACTAVSEDNWMLRLEAQGSSYFLIRLLYNLIQQNCCFHPRGTSKDQDGISPIAFTYGTMISSK